MLKKTITYEDYKGVTRTEDFYFNLTKAEIMELQMGTTGGFTDMIQQIIDAKDSVKLIKIFKEIILKAYGEKSPDGKQFDKSEEIANGFAHTEAYSELFMELVGSGDAAATFMNGIVPASVRKMNQMNTPGTPAIN